MWDLPRPGHELVSPASAGGLSTTAPQGKPFILLLILQFESTVANYSVSITLALEFILIS